jgi:hypothetical protein
MSKTKTTKIYSVGKFYQQQFENTKIISYFCYLKSAQND